MNKNDYILKVFRKILNESLNEKANSILNKLNYDDKTPFHPAGGSFDYVQEEKSMCEECGGEIKEGECSDCGYNNEGVEIIELGGMDDGHPRFGNKNFAKMSRREKADLMSDRSYEYGDDFDEDDFRFNAPSPDYDYEKNEDNFRFDAPLPDDMPSYKTKYRYSNDEITEKLHGGQHKLDKNKNGRLDREDFKMLRKQQDKEEQLYEIEFEKNEGETYEGNAFSGALANAKKNHEPEFEVDGKKYKVRESYITEKWKGDVDVKQTGEYSDMSIEELNSAIKKQKAKNDKAKEEGKKVSHADKTKMSQLYFAKRAKQGWKGKGKAKVTESILFTETDLIDLIESLVIEEKNSFKMKEPKGYAVYDKAHKADKKENEDYLKSVAKKMTEYLKNGSKGKYEMNPKHFPVGNGELEEIEKMAFSLTDDNEDFNYQIAGLQIPVPDAIEFNDERMDKYYEGSSETGNAPGGNALESKANSRFNKFRKNQTLDKLKKQAYNKSPQPVFNEKSGQEKGEGIKIKLESIEDKKVISEIEIMRNLIGYNQKTQ